ncbi:MAG: hypothetical protein HPY79_07950 [Bacteroidales bacterium]|nr:hypothetical protein [Bacteroidales bacterium]
MNSYNSILVLESPWEDNKIESFSSWPFISEFGKIYNIKTFYKMFYDLESLKHWINIYNKESKDDKKLLYIASHGENGRINGLKKSINVASIVDVLRYCKNIQFIHFSTCLTGNYDNLEYIMDVCKHIRFASGYSNVVDWIDSGAFDLMFLQKLLYWNKAKDFNSDLEFGSLIEFMHVLGFQGIFRKKFSKKLIYFPGDFEES